MNDARPWFLGLMAYMIAWAVYIAVWQPAWLLAS